MTNREYVLENIIDRLKYMIEYIEARKSSKSDFNDDATICGIADSVFRFDDCEKCSINKFCSHFADEENCYSNWYRYLWVEGDEEYENNM